MFSSFTATSNNTKPPVAVSTPRPLTSRSTTFAGRGRLQPIYDEDDDDTNTPIDYHAQYFRSNFPPTPPSSPPGSYIVPPALPPRPPPALPTLPTTTHPAAATGNNAVDALLSTGESALAAIAWGFWNISEGAAATLGPDGAVVAAVAGVSAGVSAGVGGVVGGGVGGPRRGSVVSIISIDDDVAEEAAELGEEWEGSYDVPTTDGKERRAFRSFHDI